MANALPMAIGAQFTDRRRQVVSMSGDGGFTMLMGDFLTLVQHDLPVKVVLFNNSSLGMVELEMLVAGLPSHGVANKNPDFAAVAEACGAFGVRVEKPKDLAGALKAAFKHKDPPSSTSSPTPTPCPSRRRSAPTWSPASPCPPRRSSWTAASDAWSRWPVRTCATSPGRDRTGSRSETG
ncbi:3D-(3,5/4)-trihydroxycyclohexane-1,2-dione hydrolase [Streptomyces violaceorubidus]